MNNSMNLDVNNYSNEELCNLVNLSYPYNNNQVMQNCSRLKDEILSDGSLGSQDKQSVSEFINSVQQNLLFSLQTGVTEQEKLLTQKNTSGINNVETTNKQDQSRPMATYEVSAVGGVVNPIAKNIIVKSLNIDTKFRENYYSTSSTDIHLTLPNTYKNVLAIHLRSIELPNTFYTISRGLGNNYFSISTNAISNKIVTIPDGNYTKAQFVAYVNDVALPKLGLDSEIIMSIDDTSQKTIIAKKSTGTITSLTLDFGVTSDGSEDKSNPVQLKLGWVLGFRVSKYTGSLSYASEGLCDFKGNRYLFLSVDDYNNNVNDYFASAFTSSLLGKNILGRISIKEDAFAMNSINNNDMVTKTRNYFGPVDIQKLHIQLLDEYGRNINMNSMDYSFCLDFTCIYES